MNPPRILVVEHEEDCPPAWLGEWLVDAGATLDVRRPYADGPLPADLTEHDGLVVLGGSMGADDDAEHRWLTDTKGLLREAVASDVPTLGICLGHQLLASALGGRVEPNPRGQQLDLYDIGWTEAAAADTLFHELVGSARGVQWNDDIVVEPPAGAVVLARAATGEIQALRFGRCAWGVQWHPELGASVLRPWADSDRDRAAQRGIDIDAMVQRVDEATEELQSTWRPLGSGFARVAGEKIR